LIALDQCDGQRGAQDSGPLALDEPSARKDADRSRRTPARDAAEYLDAIGLGAIDDP
jgi:hypothetical protein